MRNTVFDYIGNLDTLLAVCLGAVLATFGALVAEIVQERRNRKRLERDAARFFGDILTSFDRVLDFTFQSQTVGDPWGRITLRLFRMAQREASIYERNRERLFEIENMELRTRIHAHFLTETFPLDAIIEHCERLHDIEAELAQAKLPKAQVKSLQAEKAELISDLDGAVEAVRREHAKTPELCAELEKIGRIKFDTAQIENYETAVGLSNESEA